MITGHEGPAVSLAHLHEEIVERMKDTMRSYVIAAREEKGECWDDKERMEGGVDSLYNLVQRAGLLEHAIGYDAAREEASRRLREETERIMAGAPATIERLEGECSRERRDLRSDAEFMAYAEAQEALKYGPYILAYLDGAEIGPIA